MHGASGSNLEGPRISEWIIHSRTNKVLTAAVESPIFRLNNDRLAASLYIECRIAMGGFVMFLNLARSW